MASRSEFEAAMVAVDDELKAQDVPIPNRPLSALGPVVARLGIKDQLVPAFGDIKNPEDFSAASLGGQIHAWYERRYGDRLKLKLGISVLMEIRDDVWEVRIPVMFGRINLIADPSAMGVVCRASAINRSVTYNVLDSVAGLTPNMAGSFSVDDAKVVLAGFVQGLDVFNGLRGGKSSSFLRPAFSDLAGSVRNYLDARDYGQSMWSSLQFAEKVMKARMQVDGEPNQRTHELIGLVPSLAKHGRKISQADLREIQCKPGVRYGHPVVSPVQALRAHLAALRVAKSLWRP